MTIMATMMVMTIAIKMLMRCRRNKLVNTFSQETRLRIINVVINNVHIYCTYTSRMSHFSYMLSVSKNSSTS